MIRRGSWAAGLGLLLLPACAGAPSPNAEPGPVTVGWRQEGEASWYGKKFHGRRTASGEIYDMHELTAAHPTLPFGARVKVVRLESGRSVVVRINDRGPFKKGRIIDLSRKAARKLGMVKEGVARVRIRVLELPPAPS